MRHGRYFGRKRPNHAVFGGGTPTPTPWTPAALSSALKGWWDYSDTGNIIHVGSTLVSGTDKSGNSRTMTAGGSLTWNSTGGPGGEGVADIAGGYLEAAVPSSTFPAGFTFVSVWEKTGSGTTYNSGPITRTSGGLPAPFDANGQNRVIGDGTNYEIGAGFPGDLGSDSLFTAWNILTHYIPSISPSLDYYERINGTATYTQASLDYYGDNASVMTAGSRADRGTDANMRIGEQIACTELSSGDIEKLEGYLAWKWGLVSILDAGHPYKSAAPTL